ncbi:MAG: FAD-binding oxidoreductase [Thermoplasmata archaeon]|nr:FAD-binding oxidoreductase [Thermoplasmata archaeon]
MAPREEILILGAGIAGCALAYHLAKRGILPKVYDPRTPAAGASGRSAGVLTEQMWDRWDLELVRETRKEYAELSEGSEPSAYRRNGFLRLATDPLAVTLLDEAIARWRSWGVDVEEPAGAELSRLVPAATVVGVGRAAFSSEGAVVDPSSMVAIYAEAARRAGATFDFGRPMTGFSSSDAGWELRTGSGTLQARRAVVAAGAWSDAILRSLGAPLPLVPYRTQAVLLRPVGRPPSEFPTVHDLDLDVYVRPESEGRILAGNGTEEVEADPEGFLTSGDAGFLTRIAEAMGERFGGWRESEVLGSWAGVCTSTPDRHPIIGAVPGAPALYVIGGFNGFGIMRAAAAARRLADLICDGGSAESALEPARPDRFPNPAARSPPRPGFTVEAGDDPRY